MQIDRHPAESTESHDQSTYKLDWSKSCFQMKQVTKEAIKCKGGGSETLSSYK